MTAQLCAAQFWEKKPYQQWSKDDAQKMLTDSPWAREVVLSSVGGTIGMNETNASAGRRATGNDTTGTKVTYQVQIRSAKPIRQAVVRGEQLSPRYAQLPEDRKQRIDTSAEQFINEKQNDIVFWVTYASDVQSYNVDMLRYWQAQNMGTLANTIWLQVPGQDKVAPNYFAPGPGQSFEIHFPRPAELPRDETLVMEFRHPSGLAKQGARKVLAEFKTKKMIQEGTVVY